ncbi:phage integrase family protein [Saccharothrix carnea]|uniref:Phage integrase family protein n=1 Tax=Saccharothrix carnea TaxID=1280637 RepID=A0A2P8I476_SACCR|nr:site-specific integrase [Saccharothrix carnea]PSL53273.1 phage integrase family protein [Saccharothrix carnea]
MTFRAAQVKIWAKQLRRSLGERSVTDVVNLLSRILGEAVDEGLIGANPCRKLRLATGDQPERPHATAAQIAGLAARVSPDNAALIVTAAYTGLRWGELTGLQWARVDTANREIRVDGKDGALHEVGGKLTLGPPKTPASVRTVHLPEFLADLLDEHHDRHPHARFVFTGTDGGFHRRSNFRRRVWLPDLRGDTGRPRINTEMHFHDLRHTHKTWLIEDGVPEVLQHKRIGHKFHGVMGVYSHVTQPMIDTMLAGLQRRWEQTGSKNP